MAINKHFFTRNNEILQVSFTRNGILLETLLENRDLIVEKTLCMVVSPVSFNWKLCDITLRFVSFTKLAITRNT